MEKFRLNELDKSTSEFSVSICVYEKDNPLYFKEALESIFNQTKKPSEVVLVVDGPVTIEINEVILEFSNIPEFKVIRLEKNLGHGNARRVGIENCSNELIALMDSDDISECYRFEKQLKYFESEENLSIVGGNIKEFIDDKNSIVGIRQVPTEDQDIKKYLKKRCPFNQVTVMFKKSHIESVGGYIDWYCNEDYYLWIRMAQKNFKFKNINENLVFVRVGEDMYRRRGGIKYFKSEAKLQNYMLKNNIINRLTYIENIFIRLVVQVMMPNRIRGMIFAKFARKSCD